MATTEARLRRIAGSAAATTRAQALADLVLATGESIQGQTPAALQDFAFAAAYAPLQDVAVAGWTRCAVQAKDSAAVLAAADRYQIAVQSPFRREIALRAAQAAVETGQYAEVVTWTRGLASTPAVIWMQAQAEDALGQHRAAGQLVRELVFEHPASIEARQAADLWQRALAAYPDLAPDWRLYVSQAEGWAGGGQPKLAVASWRQALAMAPSSEQDPLLARLARALLAAGDRAGAAAEAAKLLAGPEAAQAMELQLEMQRIEHNAAALDPALQVMQQRFPTSIWYARALHEAADEALIEGDIAWTQTYFGRLSEGFPRSIYGANAAWQATWAAYRRADADTPRRLEAYLLRYPKGGQAVDALYWRGEWAERHHEPVTAQACFRTAAQRFAGTYFGLQANLAIRGAAPRYWAPWLRLYRVDPPTPRAVALPATLSPELQRADWLDSAGLLDAESQILHAVLRRLPRGPDSLRLARRVADVDAARAHWQGGLSAMLRALPNYLDLKTTQLSRSDWLRLFPRPYRADAAAAAARNRVSLALLYGIMRQESGFDPNSVSYARARGLMQLELGTAQLQWRRQPLAWRRLAEEQLRAGDLLNPALNIALGAGEFGDLLHVFDQPALALAGYNAGASRVRAWQGMQGPLPVNEFIESIPFAQTRAYVQGVLRNEMHYRRLYGAVAK